MPDSLLTVLFEPMTRGSERDDDVRSVGLGLFIVSEIAKTHGGSG
jgi:sigma-B regulation protein RsbU (phosphoserine phosphatase)